MQTNKGENMNKISSDPEGISYIIDAGFKNSIPADQYLREVNKNAEEAIQRIQKIDPSYKGTIVIKTDENYFQKNQVPKMCIIDNGDGMDYDFLSNYMLKLGASLRNNKHKNWGAGFKITALPFNQYGIIVCSWTKENPSGFGIWLHFNKTTSCYEYKLMEGNKVFKLADSSKPKEIKKHGTRITFLGDSKNHNTMEINPLLHKGGLFKGGRTGKANWIPSYLNTKKYKIEPNILTKCYDEESNTSNTRNIKGHYANLKLNSVESGFVRLSKATVDWFILPSGGRSRHTKNSMNTYALTVGQFALVHEDEVLKVDYAGKSDRNPLAAWGHQYSKYRVALVLKPNEDEFRPNLERTAVMKDGVGVDEYFDNWKIEWQGKTPTALVELEKEMAEKAIQKASNFDNELKKYANLFRNDQYMLSKKGEFDIERAKSFKTGGNKNIQGKENPESDGDSGPNPDKEYGEIEQELGIKIEKSINKGVLTRNNPYPTVGFDKEGTDACIATYEHSNYSVVINEDSLQIHQLIEHRVKKDKINNYETVKKIVLDIISFQIRQQVAHVVNITGWDEERIIRALSPESLSACLANKSMLLEKLDEQLKLTKNVVAKNLWQQDDHEFHIKINPNKFPVHEKKG
jgi:hypothetical protein